MINYKKKEGWPEGWTQSKQSMEIMVDKGFQRTKKWMEKLREEKM